MASKNTIKNGMLLGAAFGGLILFAAKNVPNMPWINWVDKSINSLADLIIKQPWASFLSSTWNATTHAGWLNYALIILIGGALGLYIEKR